MTSLSFGNLPLLHSRLALPPPVRARRVAKALVITGLISILIVLLAPWIQNIAGSGRVTAYTPLDRRQGIESPIKGVVEKWHVREGDRVKAGDLLVELSDNDPMYVQRLEAQRDAYLAKLGQYEERARALSSRANSVGTVQQNRVTNSQAKQRALGQKLRAEAQKVEASLAAYETAELNLQRVRSLFAEGLVSKRDLELAELDIRKTRTQRDGAMASLAAVQAELSGAGAAVNAARSSGEASVADAAAKTFSAQADAAATRAALQKLDAELSRQSMRAVRAARAGSIFRILKVEGGEQVKPGDVLAVLVPDTSRNAVELWVDGNDAAIISPGRAVRLQFEGWPAVQFSGWPSVAVGTFGGRVAFVDSLDDGQGNFRVVIVPDKDDEPWPSRQYLRQGVRANGWILLEEVRLGFELWRRLNGFPPVIKAPNDTAKSAEKSAK